MQSKTLRKWLLFWCLFIGIGAVGGSLMMLTDRTGTLFGWWPMLASFQVLPFADVLFQDFTFPGIALLIVNGLTNLLAAALMLRRKPLGETLGTIFGFTLMLWITIQFFIFEFNFMSTIYFVFGVAQLLTGHLLLIARKQEAFAFDASAYPNVGAKPDTLVVYFSRRGYVRKQAYERANELGADVAEVKTPEPINGCAGFLWCGRFAMHGWAMPVCELDRDVSAYAKVIFVTPIWVFNVCGPMRQALADCKGKLRAVEYVIVHFRPAQSVTKAARTMDALCGAKASRVTSVCCRFGSCRVVGKPEGTQTAA